MRERLQTAAELAEAIRLVAKHPSATEMDLVVGVEELIRPFLGPGVSLSRYGQATKLGGIKDALHGNLIIEYERPGKLSKRAGLEENVGQLQKYLLEEAAHHGHQSTAALRRMVGVGLDGEQILFVRYRGRQSIAAAAAKKPRPQLTFFPEAEPGDFSVDGPHPVSAESIDIFLGFLLSLARYPLTPEALAEAFGPKSAVAQQVVGLFYIKVLKSANRRVQTFFAEWQRIFGIVYGQDIGKAEEDAKALGKQFGVKTVPKLKEFLFAVHTYFALLMKLLAAELMTMQSGSMLRSFIQPLGSMSSDDFRKALKDLEDGGLFSRQGINNFLEGDFFAWYLSEWDKAVAQELRGLAKALASFDPRTPYLAPEQSRDLLKKLYQYLVPKKLRHDLGEFYTPDWLAEHLLNQLEYDGNLEKRLLDPACGSGTFLVLAVKRMKLWAEDHDPPISPEVTARKILDNLCGFDLNPIAVIAARTNFLLAFGELLRHIRPIEIPVYMCDSVLTPAKHRAQVPLPELRQGYDVPTRAGTFVIPREIVDAGHMDKFAGILEECVRSELSYSVGDFVRRVEKEIGLKHRESRKLLEDLHAQVVKLEKEGRNRIWARFIKNSFAPVFKSRPRFDFVVGNPPWVNWESLAEEYRNETKALWRDYGFFTQKGYRAIVPAGKLELAALFAFVSADAYLAEKGELGFVITQTVFKTTGAGEGFRKFALPGGVKLGVSQVDDFVELKPFEGAQNRTATVILKKAEETRYPVPYTVWKPSPDYLALRRTMGFEPDLEQVRDCTERLTLAAMPVDVARYESAWMTAPQAAVAAMRKVVGQSPYKAREGVNTLGANAVYWLNAREKIRKDLLVQNVVEGARKKISSVPPTMVEADLIFPLLRGRDVSRWFTRPSLYMLITHPPSAPKSPYGEGELKSRFPKAYTYLAQFKEMLKKRARVRKLGMEWYALGEIGPYTFAPHKVAWREQAQELTVAVIGECDSLRGNRTIIPDHKLMSVAADSANEAHYICALLSSTPARAATAAYSVSTQVSTHLVENIRVPKYDSQDVLHGRLTDLSKRAHELAARVATDPADEDVKRELAEVEDQVDHAAAELWGLTDAELDEIRKALEVLK